MQNVTCTASLNVLAIEFLISRHPVWPTSDSTAPSDSRYTHGLFLIYLFVLDEVSWRSFPDFSYTLEPYHF